MNIIKIRGIVLKEIVVGESNKLIVVLAKEYGKMLLSAKGARRPKSKFLAGTQLFSYCDFLVHESKGFYSIDQIDTIESFYNIRMDLYKLSYCTYFSELVERTVLEGMECNRIMELLLRTYTLLSKSEYTVKLAARIFEIKYLQLAGFMAELSCCSDCGSGFGEMVYFSPISGGMVCQSCIRNVKGIKRVSLGAYKAIQFILQSEGKKIFSFQVSEEVLNELAQIVKRFMDLHISVRFKTLQFAEDLDESYK